MIKCNVTVCGTVSKAATCRTNKEGKAFVSFAMNVVIPAKSGINKTIEVSVIKDGTLTEVGSCNIGERIEVAGVLVPRKWGDVLYFNLSASSISHQPDEAEDCIKGVMEFRGKVGKSIEDKTDKNGVPYCQFSAFSAEKVQDGFEYIWVSFFLFDGKCEAWLQPGVKANIKGALSVSVFNDKLDFSCRVSEMSIFVQQQSVECDFTGSDSWVILSPIEQSIKRKIEAVGVPLKDWDINIYRGVLTGYNDAFIISTEKRDEILANCQTEEERSKTAELIRPILRGRDIKRYEYEWANLWIINTHNGIKGKLPRIHIEDYPAVKAHLDQYWDKISKRADKGDTPYNLRNCAYLEDFFKPKIIYPNMTKYMPFVYDNEKYLTNQKCFIITGCNVAYLTAFFNSSLFKYCFRDSFPELQGGTREMSKIFFDKIPVLKVTGKVNEEFVKLIDDIQKEFTIEKAIHIDERLFDLYNLSPEERKVIGFIEIN